MFHYKWIWTAEGTDADVQAIWTFTYYGLRKFHYRSTQNGNHIDMISFYF